jgi:hypothetical protein
MDEVKLRIERALAQLGREMGSLPDCAFQVTVSDGSIQVEKAATSAFKNVRKVGKNDETFGDALPSTLDN